MNIKETICTLEMLKCEISDISGDDVGYDIYQKEKALGIAIESLERERRQMELCGKREAIDGNHIYIDDEVLVKEPWDIKIIEGYSAAICKCGYVLHIKTPKIKKFHTIVCPKCRFVVNLFCGEEGEKANMDMFR